MKLSDDAKTSKELNFIDSSVADGYIVYHKQLFESNSFGNQTAEILDRTTSYFPALLRFFLTDNNFEKDNLVYMRLKSTDISKIKQAEASGFYYVESSVISSLVLRKWNCAAYSRHIKPMTSITAKNLPEVEGIACTIVRNLRFNLDLSIGNEWADARYLASLRNAWYYNEDIIALTHHDKIVGFSLLRFEGSVTEASPKGEKVICRLSGLCPNVKNASLGMIIYALTVAYCQDHGVKRIKGGLSMVNLPAFNIHSNLGFLYRDPTVVLHYYISE